MDRLTMPNNEGMCMYEDKPYCPDENCTDICLQERMKKLWKYENLEEQGLLLRLPCKVGDTVWKIKAVSSYCEKPKEDRIDRIIISDNQVLMCCISGAEFSIDSVGKVIFSTREAAEKITCRNGATKTGHELHELPKEIWLSVAERLNTITPIIANQLKKLNYEGQGKQDAVEFMNDMMLAKIALNYVAESAIDKCKFIGI